MGRRRTCNSPRRMPAAPDATAEHIKDVNTRYHDVAAESYDSKWGIDFGEIGQEQVRGKMRKALGTEPRRRSATRSRSAPAPATSRSTCCSGGAIGNATATDISPGMLDALQRERRAARARGRDASRPRPRRLPFDDESFDLVFGHAVLHHIPDLAGRRASSCACCGRAGRSSSAASPRATAIVSRRCRSGSGAGRAAVAHALRRRQAERRRRRRRPSETTTTRSRARSTCTPSIPPRSARFVAARRLRRVRVSGEELLANISAGACAPWRRSAEPDERPDRLAQVRLPLLHRACRRSTRAAARAAPAAAALLQPGDQRPQAGASGARVSPGCGRRSSRNPCARLPGEVRSHKRWAKMRGTFSPTCVENIPCVPSRPTRRAQRPRASLRHPLQPTPSLPESRSTHRPPGTPGAVTARPATPGRHARPPASPGPRAFSGSVVDQENRPRRRRG